MMRGLTGESAKKKKKKERNAGYRIQTIRLLLKQNPRDYNDVYIWLEMDWHVPTHPAGCKRVPESCSVIPRATLSPCLCELIQWGGLLLLQLQTGIKVGGYQPRNLRNLIEHDLDLLTCLNFLWISQMSQPLSRGIFHLHAHLEATTWVHVNVNFSQWFKSCSKSSLTCVHFLHNSRHA